MDPSGRWQRIAELLRAAAEGSQVGPALAEAAAEALEVDGVGLTMVSAGTHVATFGGSPMVVGLSERQFMLGEGPAVLACRSGAPVLADDLSAADVADRSPVFAREAQVAGMAAVFAFPLRIGGATIGAMTAYRTSAGPLSAAQFTDGLILSELVTIALIEQRAATLADVLETTWDAPAVLEDVVNVAAGMLSEQLGVPVVEALVRIRARAFADDVTVVAVARRIVARELRLER